MDRRTFLAATVAGAALPITASTAGVFDATEPITVSEPEYPSGECVVRVDGPMDEVIENVLDIFDRGSDHYYPMDVDRSGVRQISLALDETIDVYHWSSRGLRRSHLATDSDHILQSHNEPAGDVVGYLADRYDAVPTKLVQSVHIDRDHLEVTYLDTRVPGVGPGAETDWYDDE